MSEAVTPRERVSRLERRNAYLESRIRRAEQIAVLALHELAIEKKKEPLHFIRRWLSEHKDEGGDGTPTEIVDNA
jgi:hypothetical protein